MKEAYRDEVPDVIRHADFVRAWPEVRERLVGELQAGTYTPRLPQIVEVPKGELATRPIAVLDLAGRIVFDAVMMRLAPAIDAEIVEEVFSSRLRVRKGKPSFPDQRKAWIGFQRAGWELAERYEDACMLTTDVTSYFEFINIDLLLTELRAVPGMDQEAIDLLARLLHGFADESALNGIPQGPEVSSLLGNFYLRPLDAILRKLDVKFIRFQDDIKAFANASHVLRRAVHELTPVVRSRHLNLSTGKTLIIEGPAVFEHFEDSRKNALQYRIDVEDDTVGAALRAFFDDAVADRVNERDVRFTVYRMARLHDDYAVPWILDHLAEVPFLSGILVEYLSSHIDDHPEIQKAVVEFLQNEEANISPYVEMQLIRMFANAPEISEQTYAALWHLLMNAGADPTSRQFAARAVGRHLNPAHSADMSILRGLFDKCPERRLRRALLVALKEAGDADKRFLGIVAAGDPDLTHTCEYLRSNPRLPPP